MDAPSYGRLILVGERYHLAGFPTKVEVIGKEFTQWPECRVIEASPKSQYKPGDKKRFPCALLYRNACRTSKKKRRRMKNV